MKKLLIVFTALLMFACQKETPVFKPSLMALTVKNIDSSVTWYVDKLGFKIENPIKDYPDYGLKISILELEGFRLELIENTKSINRSEVLKDNDSYLGGFFKLGLKLKDIQTFYDTLQNKEGINFITGIGDLPEYDIPIQWPSKYFLITDPDGNYLQFFDTGLEDTPTPWLNMIVVENLDEAIIWYENTLQTRHIETVGTNGNKRAIIERNGYVFELFEPMHVIKANQINKDTVYLGFSKMALDINNIEEYATNLTKGSNEIVIPVTDSDFEWSKKHMIFKDLEGNWIQFYQK